MKITKKVVIILIIIGIILACVPIANTSNARISINKADLYTKGDFTNLLQWQGAVLNCEFVVYKHNGVEYPAYCMDRTLPGPEAGEYTVSIDSVISNVKVWRAIINGYPYKTYKELGCDNKEQAYMATKQAVYCMLYDRDPNTYSAVSGGEKCLAALKNIVAKAKNSNVSPIGSGISVTADNTQWTIDSINNKYVSTTYKTAARGAMQKYEVSLNGDFPEGTYITDTKNNKQTTFNSGEKFKILIPATNIRKTGNFFVDVKAKVQTRPVLYGKSPSSSLQDHALTGDTYEDGEGRRRVYYTKNETKIIILKQEAETKIPLQGVEFELLDENQKVIQSSLVTNSKGEVTINDLLPGKYYVREVHTLEGYMLYDKLIEVELELNETSKVIINNSEEAVDVEIETPESELEVKEVESVTSSGINKTVQTIKLPKTGM